MLCRCKIAAYSFQVVYELSSLPTFEVPQHVSFLGLLGFHVHLFVYSSQLFLRGYRSASAGGQTFILHGRFLSIA